MNPQNLVVGGLCHKHKCAGLRYEVGICIQTRWIVWTNGPYPCIMFPDVAIARHLLIPEFLPGEMFMAHWDYRDGYTYANTPTGWINPSQRMKAVVPAHHETVNSWIKICTHFPQSVLVLFLQILHKKQILVPRKMKR
jgi:hypothetical protein